MSNVYLDDSVLTDIADAIRTKTQKSGLITPANMPTEIESISGGGSGSVVLNTLEGTTKQPSATTPDIYLTTILADRSMDDIKVLFVREESDGNKIIVFNNINGMVLSNVTFRNVHGKLYMPCDTITYNTSYGTYTDYQPAWGVVLSNMIFNLFVPDNSTDCYWLNWSSNNTYSFQESEKDNAITLYEGTPSAGKICVSRISPYSSGITSQKKIRFWIVEEE